MANLSSFLQRLLLKANKIVGGAAGNLVSVQADGDIADSGVSPNNFMRTDGNTSTSGTVTINNSLGLTIEADLPRLKFANTAVGQDSFWCYTANDVFYILTDRDGDGTWEVPHPLTLDNVSGSIVAYGNVVWTAGNDGPGSGLDADTVDGLQSTQFLRSDVTTTFTGNTFSLNATGIQIHLDDHTAPDGKGIKRITCNDGFGNWNFRSGCYSDTVNGSLKYTTDTFAAASITINTENTTKSEIVFDVYPPGTLADDPVANGIRLLMDSTGTFVYGGNSIWHSGNIATQAQAEAGVNNSTGMTPLRTAQAINAISPPIKYALLVNTTAQSVTVANVWQRRTNWTLHETFGAQTWLTRDDVAGQFTINEAGTYRVSYRESFDYNGLTFVGNVYSAFQIVSNGVVTIQAGSSNSVGPNNYLVTATLTRDVQLSAGDVIEPIIYMTNTLPIATSYSSTVYTQLLIEKIG